MMRASELRAVRKLIKAYAGPFPIRAHRTLAEAMDWPDAPLPQEFECPAEGYATADHGGGCEGSAPEGTSGASVEQPGYAPANVDQRHLDTRSRANAGDEAEGVKLKAPAVEPVSRAAAGRSAAATSEPMDVTAGETAPVAAPVSSKGLAVAERIDLGSIVSEMDRQAAKGKAARAAHAVAAAPDLGGLKVLCRCGASAPGAAHGLVPTWFGRDCIERDCALKGSACGQ